MIDFLQELSNFIFTSKYARYDEEKKRRETWPEAVDRVRNMHLNRFAFLPAEDKATIHKVFEMVKEDLVVPSMRSMQFGGKAIEAKNERLFNCSCRHMDSLRSFAEVFFLLLCGCGVTIGLNKKFLGRLPNLVSTADRTDTTITYIIEDTIEGWADSVEALMNCYFKNTPYTGRRIVFDYSKIRKKGSTLKTGGGKAPGANGLKHAHQQIKKVLDHAIEYHQQSRLRSIDAYDIVMHCADAVLSGGVRRAATAAIFHIDDVDMLNAKADLPVTKYEKFAKSEKTTGGYVWYDGFVWVDGIRYEVEIKEFEYQKLVAESKIFWKHIHPQRGRSNNSVLLIRNKISIEEFRAAFERTKLYGEPGFVFGEDEDQLFNPCYEVSFIPVTIDGVAGVQFCNLSSVNGAKVKTFEQMLEAVWAATVIGTLQAAYTQFPYLSNAAQQLTEEEALLGVSITGIMDSPEILLNPRNQFLAAQYVIHTNKEWAAKLGINQAARTTLVKPEGTSSLKLKSASGIHPHHAHRYFRRVQANKVDPIYKFFKKHNPHMCEESVWSQTKSDDVITFPVEVPTSAMVKADLTAIKHLDIIKNTQQNWVDTGTTEANRKPIRHNVSCTVEVDPNEWEEVILYLYENRQFFSAVSLLPKSGDRDYEQAPLQRITDADEEQYRMIVEKYKPVDYTKLIEDEDRTSIMETIACAGGACEVVFPSES